MLKDASQRLVSRVSTAEHQQRKAENRDCVDDALRVHQGRLPFRPTPDGSVAHTDSELPPRSKLAERWPNFFPEAQKAEGDQEEGESPP